MRVRVPPRALVPALYVIIVAGRQPPVKARLLPLITMKLLIASRNSDKLAEIRAVFVLPGLQLLTPEAFPGLPEVEEDGLSFQANSVKKAVSLAMRARCWTLADDSGLEVEALNGAPGVCSARYAGQPSNTAANNAKLLAELKQSANRTARFVCVLALASPSGRAQIVEGVCQGRILHSARGTKGFGYDPLFVPEGHVMSFAEMDPSLKNTISHRARALQAAQRAWCDLLRGRATDWPAQRRPRD